jgi:hypothetical protein
MCGALPQVLHDQSDLNYDLKYELSSSPSLISLGLRLDCTVQRGRKESAETVRDQWAQSYSSVAGFGNGPDTATEHSRHSPTCASMVGHTHDSTRSSDCPTFTGPRNPFPMRTLHVVLLLVLAAIAVLHLHRRRLACQTSFGASLACVLLGAWRTLAVRLAAPLASDLRAITSGRNSGPLDRHLALGSVGCLRLFVRCLLHVTIAQRCGSLDQSVQAGEVGMKTDQAIPLEASYTCALLHPPPEADRDGGLGAGRRIHGPGEVSSPRSFAPRTNWFNIPQDLWSLR